MKKISLIILSAAVFAVLASGCGRSAKQAETASGTSAEASFAARSSEKEGKLPTLPEIVEANKISSLLSSYSSVYMDTEYYMEEGVMSHLSQYWKNDDFGPVGIFYQTDPTEEEPFYEYMYDGRDYRKEYDGSLSARFASSPEAIQSFRGEIDASCSPLITVGDESVKSCVRNGDFLELETDVSAESLTALQKDAYEITEGRLITKSRLSAKDLHVISLDTFREDPDGTQVLMSKMTMETDTDQPDLPSFMKEFENPEETRTVTLIFNPGTAKENTASYALPKDSGFYPDHEEKFYDIYGDTEKKTTFSDLLMSSTRGADLTLYLFRKEPV